MTKKNNNKNCIQCHNKLSHNTTKISIIITIQINSSSKRDHNNIIIVTNDMRIEKLHQSLERERERKITIIKNIAPNYYYYS